MTLFLLKNIILYFFEATIELLRWVQRCGINVFYLFLIKKPPHIAFHCM